MLILIPAFGPGARLPELVAELLAGDPEVRVLVVDDGSGAAFAEVFGRAEAVGAEVLRHDRNRGKGVALKTGFAHALRRFPDQGVVTADADGQHETADVLAIASRLREAGPGAPMILGCRAFDGEVPARSRIGNAIARVLFRAAAGWSLSDTQTGLRGIPAAMLPWLLEVPGERFEYEQQVLLRLRRAGFSACEQRIATVYLAGNESSHFRPVLDSLRVMLPVAVFAASSLTAFAIDAVALFLLQAATGLLVPSIIAARLLSASVNFWVNRRVVFMRHGPERLRTQIVQYALLSVLLLASNVVWMSYLTDLGVPLWIAKVITELVLFLTSYRVQRSVVFAPRPESAAAIVGDVPARGAARTTSSQ